MKEPDYFVDDEAWEQRCLEAEERAKSVTFPNGSAIGEWVVICTNPKCLRCGRNPDHMTCPICGGKRIPTVDYILSKQKP